MSLSFSIAIPIFLLFQTAIFLALITLSKKIRTKDVFKIPSKIPVIIIRILYALLITGSLLTTFMSFRYNILYNYLVMLTPIVLLFLIASGFSHKMMLAIAIMWHYIIIAPEVESDFISITEGTHMTRTMILYGRWLPELAHNPSYNPFPTMDFIRTTLSLLTGIPWYNQFIALIMLIVVFIAFNLVVFILSSKMVSDNSVGILAIIILALTPYLLVTSHSYQVPANLMWLLSVYSLIRLLNIANHKYALLAILLFISAILTHATAYIAMMFPVVFLVIRHLGNTINNKVLVNNHSHIGTLTLILIIIGLFRFIYEEVYAQYIGKIYFVAARDLIVRIFMGEGLEAKLTLYEYGGTPFYQAFLWSLTASLACALIIQSFFERNVNSILLSLFLTASIFIGFGYITATIIETTTQLYRGSYVAFSLLVPLAALTVKKVLDSRSKCLLSVLFLTFLFASFLALNDPQLSPIVARKVKGIPEEVNTTSVADLIKVNYIMNFAENMRVVNNIALYSKTTLVYWRRTAFQEQIKTIFSRVGDALYKTLYMNGYTVGGHPTLTINYILPEELSENTSTFNIIYCSGEETFFLRH